MRYGIREDWQGKLKDYFVRYAERAAVVAALAAVSYGWVSFCPAKNIGWFLLDGVLYTLLFGLSWWCSTGTRRSSIGSRPCHGCPEKKEKLNGRAGQPRPAHPAEERRSERGPCAERQL